MVGLVLAAVGLFADGDPSASPTSSPSSGDPSTSAPSSGPVSYTLDPQQFGVFVIAAGLIVLLLAYWVVRAK